MESMSIMGSPREKMSEEMNQNQESVQLLNTAIIKSKEKKINSSYEERLSEICSSPVVKYINQAVTGLAEHQNISRDQAAVLIMETMRELDSIWSDYITMEGIGKLKEILKNGMH